MHRRQFLKGAAVLSVLSTGGAPGPAPPVRRVRPHDPSWPSEAGSDIQVILAEPTKFEAEQPIKSTDCSVIFEPGKQTFPPQII